jgi:hypothetical protein
LHYAATALSDSIAGSLFVVALAGVARMAVRGDRSPRTVAVVCVATLGAALVRSEKAIVLATFAVAALLVLLVARLWRGQVATGRFRGVVVAVVVAVILPSVAAVALNRATQTADHGRPPLTVEATVFNRIVWPHLAEIRDELPADARARISPEDAAAFDSNNNNVMSMIQLMREIDGGGDRVIGAAIRAALACCAGAVALDTVKDATEYALAPVTFVREGVPVLLPDAPEPYAGRASTVWNITRMNAAHPTLSAVWLAISWGLLALLVATALAARLRPEASVVAGQAGRGPTAMLVTIWLGTVLNGCFFAASQGADANLRYAIGTVLAIMCALAVMAVAPNGETSAAPHRAER